MGASSQHRAKGRWLDPSLLFGFRWAAPAFSVRDSGPGWACPLGPSKVCVSIRAELRQQGIDDRKLKFSTEEDFPPPLCNRMGVNWRKTTNDCSCKKWPEWVRRNLGVTAACKQQREPITDSAGNEGVVIRGGQDYVLESWSSIKAMVV